MIWKNISEPNEDGVDPKNLGYILLKGKLDTSMLNEDVAASFPVSENMVVVGYYDWLDEAWALSSTPFYGPFFIPSYYAECSLLTR